MPMDDGLDQALSAVGLGRWQIPYIGMFCLVTWIVPVHLIGSTFLSAPVAFRCSYANETETRINFINLSSSTILPEWDNDPPYYDKECVDTATWNEDPEGNITTGRTTGLTSCPLVEYDPTIFTSTVITEWNLICEQEILRPLFQMMFSIGSIIGTAISGPFSDSFGRKRTLQVATIMTSVAILCMYFMPWYTALLFLRAVIGATCNCMVLPSYNLALEAIPPESRSWIGVLIGLSFSIGVLGFAGLGYFIRSWRTLMLASSSTLIILLPLTFLVGESPRWLMQNGGQEKVAKMMAQAAKTNRRHLNDTMNGAIERLREKSNGREETPQKANSSIKQSLKSSLDSALVYFRSTPMCVIILITPLIWVLQNCLYLGIMLNANNFTSSNPIAYVAISGAMDGLAIIMATPFTMKLGRRVSLFICFLFGGLFLMIDLAVPTDLRWISWFLVMMALLLSAASVQINFLYTSEMFPTSIRARGFAWAHFAGNVGFALAPLVTDLLSQQAWWAVSVTFGCAGLVAAALVPLLPETNNRPLPETILDVEERYLDNKLEKRRKKRKASIKEKQGDEKGSQQEALPLT